jgi:hypothetical protein
MANSTVAENWLDIPGVESWAGELWMVVKLVKRMLKQLKQ